MPELEMRVKSKTNFLRKFNRKSTKISKSSRPQIKSSVQEKAGNLNRSPWNVYSNIEVSGQNIQITEANDCQDTITGDSTHLLERLQSSPDSTSVNEMEPIISTSSSDLKTVFSPGCVQNVGQFGSKSHHESVEDEQSELPYLVTNEVDDSCLSEFKDFNAYNFHITENVTALPDIDLCEMIYGAYPDYEVIDSFLMLDVEKRSLQPFSGKPSETFCLNDDKSIGEPVYDFADSCIESPDGEAQIKCIVSYFEFNAFSKLQPICKNLLDPSYPISTSCPPLPAKGTQNGKPITLVLDLDETLVHSKLEYWDEFDFTFPVFFDMKQHTVYVKRRPHLQMFLERVAQIFQVVIFTASQSIYADKLINILDPYGMLISSRYYRESCIFSNGCYTKDLTILRVDMAKVVIVDNSPQVFRLQVNNGIPIKSWFDDPADQALVSLLPFLETLAKSDDVRPLIAEKFCN